MRPLRIQDLFQDSAGGILLSLGLKGVRGIFHILQNLAVVVESCSHLPGDDPQDRWVYGPDGQNKDTIHNLVLAATLLHKLSYGRKFNGKCGALSNRAFHLDSAVMILDDPLNDGQP